MPNPQISEIIDLSPSGPLESAIITTQEFRDLTLQAVSLATQGSELPFSAITFLPDYSDHILRENVVQALAPFNIVKGYLVDPNRNLLKRIHMTTLSREDPSFPKRSARRIHRIALRQLALVKDIQDKLAEAIVLDQPTILAIKEMIGFIESPVGYRHIIHQLTLEPLHFIDAMNNPRKF